MVNYKCKVERGGTPEPLPVQPPGVEAVYKVLEGSTMTYLKCFRSPQEQNLEMVRLLEEAGFKIVRTTSTFGAEHTEPVNGHWIVTFTD